MYWLALFLAFVATVSCHSWIEELRVIAPNGTFVGEPGYIRGVVRRGTAEFSDTVMTNLIPLNGRPSGNVILPSDPISKESQRNPGNQPADSPVLIASPGDAVALRFQENGHVSLPQNQPGKPPNRGNIYVYGTADPKPDDTLLAIHNVWNAEGTGGDKRGKLLSVSAFDDGQCYQVNDGQISTKRQQKFKHTADELMGADLWCQQDFALPSDVPVGKLYTLYWVWWWPTLSQEGLTKLKEDPSALNDFDLIELNETYTSVADIKIVGSSNQKRSPASQYTGASFVEGQDLNFAAIPEQMAKLGETFVGNAIPDGAETGSSEPASPAPAASQPSSVAPSSVSAQTSFPANPASSSTSAVPAAVSAMNAPQGSAPSVVTVTVTDYVPSPTSSSEATQGGASPSDSATPKEALESMPPLGYRLRARGATLTTVALATETPSSQAKRFYILPEDEAARPDDHGIAPGDGSAKETQNLKLSAKFRKLLDT